MYLLCWPLCQRAASLLCSCFLDPAPRHKALTKSCNGRCPWWWRSDLYLKKIPYQRRYQSQTLSLSGSYDLEKETCFLMGSFFFSWQGFLFCYIADVLCYLYLFISLVRLVVFILIWNRYYTDSIFVLKAYFNKDFVQQTSGCQKSITVEYETKTLISLANPVSDFLHCSRLLMNIEKI
jgi:hypothetical protein